jgi:nicotinamidase-related amidase
MTGGPRTLVSDTCHLVVIDVQERLAPAMPVPDAVPNALGLLLAAARTCRVPVTVSEQYPKGLGATLPAVVEALPEHSAFVEKMTFSAMREPDFAARIEGVDRPRLVVTGMETHVCVLQTVLDALHGGLAVSVVADAVASRTAEDRLRGLDRMHAAGAEIVTAEMVVFEWLERAGTPAFKALSPLIRDRGAAPRP